MARRQLVVVRVGEAWKVLGDPTGRLYPSCAAAGFAAARLMVAAEDAGDEVEVLVQERFGMLRTVTPIREPASERPEPNPQPAGLARV